MKLSSDYILSASLSLLFHGAAAASIYGALVYGPGIQFQSGNNGFDVSIISPAELTGSASTVEAQKPSEEDGPRMSLYNAEAEISVKRVKNQKLQPAERRTVEVKKFQAPPAEVKAPTTPHVSEIEGPRPCSGESCNQSASLGRSGDKGDNGVEIISAPKPPYPWAARRAGFRGESVVSVQIAKDGSVEAAALAKSSGRQDCDQSALETIRERWRFEPARRNGEPIEWHENIVVVYNLLE
ncbi:MAG: energy transducer TonB [Deltaproteobacteria bacterium]|nr:energy transducer TonB [Deltaproteobacteria bacterium]